MRILLTQIDTFLIVVVGMLVVPDDGQALEDLGDSLQGRHRDLLGYDLVPRPHDVDVWRQFGADNFQVL